MYRARVRDADNEYPIISAYGVYHHRLKVTIILGLKVYPPASTTKQSSRFRVAPHELVDPYIEICLKMVRRVIISHGIHGSSVLRGHTDSLAIDTSWSSSCWRDTSTLKHIIGSFSTSQSQSIFQIFISVIISGCTFRVIIKPKSESDRPPIFWLRIRCLRLPLMFCFERGGKHSLVLWNIGNYSTSRR